MKIEPKLGWLALLWALIIGLWALSGWLLYPNEMTRGSFGDMFGAVNALFSGLAFATLIYTAWMQRDELILQRAELALQRDEVIASRKELEGQKEQLKAQNETFALQRFEGTFFELLRLHGQIVDTMTMPNSNAGAGSSGRSCFFELDGLFQRLQVKRAKDNAAGVWTAEWIQGNVRGFTSNHEGLVGHYFRHLVQTLGFVWAAPGLSVVQKQQYSNLVRGLLSLNELKILLYFCLGTEGTLTLAPLASQCALFEDLPPGQVSQYELYIPFLDPAMFGSKARAWGA